MENDQTNENVKSANYSWAVVVIVLIIFWPVGIYLLYRKLSVNKKSAMSSGKTISIIGWALLAIGVIATIVGPSDPSQAVSGRILYLVIFAGGGLAMVLIGLKTQNEARKIRKYIAIIINQNITSIDKISSVMPVEYSIAVKDIQKIIDQGFFGNAYIDYNSRSIQLPKEVEEPENAANVEVVICKSCGASNKITKGAVSNCEYCDSPLIAR